MRTIVNFNLSDVKQLIREYYSGSLKRSDRDASLKKLRAFSYEPISSGKKLSHLFTYVEINRIILEKLVCKPCRVGEITVQSGWHDYVLQVWIGKEDQDHERNILMPFVEQSHMLSSAKLFCTELEVLIDGSKLGN